MRTKRELMAALRANCEAYTTSQAELHDGLLRALARIGEATEAARLANARLVGVAAGKRADLLKLAYAEVNRTRREVEAAMHELVCLTLGTSREMLDVENLGDVVREIVGAGRGAVLAGADAEREAALGG